MKTLFALVLAALLGVGASYAFYGEASVEPSALGPAVMEIKPDDSEDRARSLIESRLLTPMREPKPMREHLIFASRVAPIIPMVDRPLKADVTALDVKAQQATGILVANAPGTPWRWRREVLVDLAHETVAVKEGAEVLLAEDWLRRLRLSEQPPAIAPNPSIAVLDESKRR